MNPEVISTPVPTMLATMRNVAVARPNSAGIFSWIVPSGSATQAGAPVFPNILSAAVPLVTLVNLTTMDPHLQNAYSRQASVEGERQIGALGTFSLGYQYVRGLNLLMSINQNVPGCVAVGETRAEVKQLIREAIELHIENLRENGESVPRPHSFVEVIAV